MYIISTYAQNDSNPQSLCSRLHIMMITFAKIDVFLLTTNLNFKYHLKLRVNNVKFNRYL